MMWKPPPTPYCGFQRNTKTNNLYVARSAAHVLVSAPTETGKTRMVLAPAAVLWTGPAIIVSSKDDLFQLVMQRRFGPNALIDLRPDYEAVYPDIPMMGFDPTKMIHTPDQAVTAANTMMQMSAVGLGSGADQVSDAGIWESNTEGPLAAMLYAAAKNDLGMDWVLLAVDNMEFTEEGTLALEPGWQQAAELVQDMPLFHNALRRTLKMDPKQRDSIALTMRKAVMPWMRLSLRGVSHEAFSEDFLDDPNATLYVLSSPEGAIAGAAVTLLENVIKLWRAKTARQEMRHRLLIIVDEATNVAPMPALRRHIGEGRGLGVNLLLAVQASCQFDTVYGSVYANELRAIFPAALIMFGAPEMDMLRRAEEWSLETTRRQETFDQASSNKTLSSHTGSTLDYRRLMPPNKQSGRLLLRGTPGVATELLDWSEFIGIYDEKIRQLATGQDSPQRSAGWHRLVERHRAALERAQAS
jgi:type IV secretory pathway TraG/TraD family ATPase VirD4